MATGILCNVSVHGSPVLLVLGLPPSSSLEVPLVLLFNNKHPLSYWSGGTVIVIIIVWPGQQSSHLVGPPILVFKANFSARVDNGAHST